MKEKPDDKARLLHILDAIEEIELYLKDISFDDFCHDSKTRFATIKQLEIIGEAASHVSASLKKVHSTIPWQQIIALRHLLVHEYYGIQNEILWRIATADIPGFKKEISKIR